MSQNTCLATPLMALPPDVRRRFGYALSLAQMGDQDDAAKVLKGFGGSGWYKPVRCSVAPRWRLVTRLLGLPPKRELTHHLPPSFYL